ncbi:MAG: prepilin-type N-terminal cleavage/methylation domain-containing protein [Eubacterium sp.]|nr:prepilin-type N-terminal cleavage/methylation domain-containing protein [Eubacterium sp.]
MRENNHIQRDGFSLVELIITIAVMAILIGILSLSVSLMNSADTRGLANGINDSLTDLKSLTESHEGPYYLHIYKKDSGFYANFGDTVDFTVPDDPGDDERLGKATMKVELEDSVTTTTPKVDGDGNPVLGSDGTQEVESTTTTTKRELEEDQVTTIKIKKKDGSYEIAPSAFSVTREGNADYKVILAKDTGIHYVE